MELADIAALARRWGRGYPVLFCDLAAVDRNIAEVAGFAGEQGWGVRPALKTFRSPRLIGYILARLPEPRGLVFNLNECDAIFDHAPRGTDLMCGYAPTVGELRTFLRQNPRGRRRDRVRITIDSVELLEHLARFARSTRRPLPLEVALEIDVGMGRGGMNNSDGGAETEACLEILRAERKRLKLTAILGYDGQATLDGNPTYRKLAAEQAMAFYREHMARIAELGGDLYDPATLITNGPGSSNYRNWIGGPANEIGVGTAFVYASYLDGGYETEGLAPALTAAGAVRRITSDHPSAPLTGTSPPDATEQEIQVQAFGDPGDAVWPDGIREDQASGGGDTFVVPKGSVTLGDYILYRPHQAEPQINRFGTMLAVREGEVLQRWGTLPRPGKRRRALRRSRRD